MLLYWQTKSMIFYVMTIISTYLLLLMETIGPGQYLSTVVVNYLTVLVGEWAGH